MRSRLLLVSGSLRSASTNAAVLRTAIEIAPAGVDCHLYDGLGRLPAFNPDDDQDPLPLGVAGLREAIHRASAVLFCTPEYAGALPGSLKNMLDWTIGDQQPGSIYGKPVGWVNASPRGAHGAYAELRTVLGYANAHIVDMACIDLPVTWGIVGPEGTIANDAERQALVGVLASLLAAARASTP